MYGGGPLPTEAGNKIAAGTHLITVFGSSETGFFPVEVLEPEDWQCVKLSPFAGGKFRKNTNTLYELVLARDSKLAEYQPVFCLPGAPRVRHQGFVFETSRQARSLALARSC